MLMVTGADHIARAGGGDTVILLAIPLLWILGVVLFVIYKFRTR